ncbi:MAG: InlB B-repeat-containing protein [Paludibacteraceae bacterium]|nr:InlB B-repeat-containing protein [Paludibacteraceae bacterium]
MKNLINYLSKKSLSLENGSRLVRDRFEIGSAKSRKSIGSNLSQFSLVSLICLCMLTIGSGNVWGTTSVTGTYKLVTSTTGIAAGDTVLLVNKAGAKALTAISTTSTKYGTLADVTVTNNIITLSNADVEELKVETGSSSGSFSFKGTGDITNYLYWKSGNSLNQNATKNAKTSWTLNSYAAANGMTIANCSTTTRIIRFNSDRFACYTSNTGTLVNLYKKVYAVKYDKNGGTGTMTDASSPYNRGTNVAVLSNSFTAPSGKVFDKWNTKADGSGTSYAAGATISSIQTSITLYAQWKSSGTSVTLSKAAATNGSFTLSNNGPLNTATAQTITVTGTPNTGYYLSGVTQSGASSTPTITKTSATTYTIQYPASCTGTSTITATFSPIWYLKGDFNSWGTTDPLTDITSNVATVTKSLSKTTAYEFKVYNAKDDTWYGNNGKIIDDISGWTFSTSEDNCQVFATVADDYTFKFNISNQQMQVIYPDMTHPNDAYVYLTNWWDCYVHYWYTDGGGDHALITWGYDTQLSRHEEICGTDYWCVPILDGYPKLIMKDNAGNPSNTTGDQTTASNAEKYITHNGVSWGWHEFTTYTISYDKGTGTGDAMASHANLCPGSNQTLTANTYTKDHYHFTGWVANVNVKIGGSTVTAGTLIADEATIQDIQSNITLTAQWEGDSYTITKTLTNVTSSPAIPSSYTYTGSAAGLTYTISANDGYRLPTSITVSGTTYTWNSATGALTLTGTITSNVSITITAVQTHTVDWYVGGSAPGNKLPSSGQTVVVDHGGSITTLPSEPSGSACDKEFMGWTNTSSYTHGTSPLYSHNTASFPAIDADASFYAVFATESGTPITWSQITDATNVTAGTYVIVASTSTQTGYLPTATASSSGPLFTTSGLTIADGKITSTVTDAMKWTFSSGSWDDDYDYMEGISITNQDATPLYLNNTNANNGVRVDNTSDKTWTFQNHESGASDVLSMWCNGRYCGVYNNADWRSYTTYDATNYEADAGSSKIKLFKQTGGTTYSDYTIVCGSCSNEVTVAYTAAPTGGTVAVTKGGTPVAVNGTVKTCTGGASLVVTVTPSTHYSVSGVTFTPSAGLVAGDLSGTSTPASTTAGVWTYNVTIAEDAAGTLTIAPTFEEDAHIAINWNVNGVNQSIAATEGLTWVYSGGDLTALPSTPSVPAGCSGTKVFAGWSAKHSDATEEDASYYDDLFTAVGDAPTGISSEKTFYAVFATSSANPLAGEVMWDEPWTGTSDKTTPTSPSSGATVYNSTVLTYAYTDGNTITQVYADGTMYSGGAAAPELLISKTSPSGVWTVTNIPTGGSAQTELTLSYKTNKTTIAVTSGTSGITIGDATVDGNTYTHTITISHSPSTINNFSLIFTNTGSANARLDDIHLVVPGSGTMTDYVTLCAPSWTITYDKNTSDPVTNLPSPTSVLQSTGSGTLSSTVPERATYTFSGWAETTSGAVAYAAGGSITGVTGDKTLYAVWTKTPVEELFLNYSELNKYVGDPAVTLEVTGVTPAGADATVTWSSNNSTVASVVAATGVVTFGTVGTATITATSSVTGTTTAYCYVTVRNKPTASFTDLIHDGNGTNLSTYHMQNVAGTAIVFPTLDDYATPGDDCDSKHYIFVGWTTSDNNGDPEDHLVTSDELEDDQDKVFYAVWADGVEGVSYTKLTSNSFETGSTRYVIGVESGGDTYYLYDCASTDANNSWGYTTNAPGTNAPIQFSLSGTASALVVTSTEATARYLTPLTAKNFQMSATSKTVKLNSDGTIHNTGDNSAWNLRGNSTNLRWYDGTTGTSAFFYKITAGAAVSYRTSCCTNNVPAPTVVATNTAYTVTLTWAAVVGATGYEVSWNGGAFTAATSPCVKSDLTASTDYTYKVRATYDPLVKCGALVASGSVTTDDVYTVTYSGGTGTGSCSPSGSVAPASYEAGATVTLAPTNSFSLTSNTFAAWVVKDADDNDVPVSNNQFTMPAKNVTVTATWTAVQDKYYDRMHDGTDGSHGGIADGEGKYYLALEGCNYTVPTLTDDNDGDTDCHTTHYKLLGWIAYSHLKTDGSGEIKPGEESYIFQGGGTKSATGATYYAIWAIMTE